MMFEKYMKERQNADLYQTDRGFIFYRIEGFECFIVELFVEEEHRGSSALKELIETVELQAKDCECKALTGNIYLSDKGCNRTLNAAFKMGFKLGAANNNVLFIVKEL
jgi:hypothetical protein